MDGVWIKKELGCVWPQSISKRSKQEGALWNWVVNQQKYQWAWWSPIPSPFYILGRYVSKAWCMVSKIQWALRKMSPSLHISVHLSKSTEFKRTPNARAQSSPLSTLVHRTGVHRRRRYWLVVKIYVSIEAQSQANHEYGNEMGKHSLCWSNRTSKGRKPSRLQAKLNSVWRKSIPTTMGLLLPTSDTTTRWAQSKKIPLKWKWHTGEDDRKIRR